MVPSLSASKKLNTNGTFILTLFGLGPEFSPEPQDIDIILEGQNLVLPGAVNMMFMVPRGGLRAVFPRNTEFAWPPWPLE